MPALETPEVNIGWKASPFKLKATDGNIYTLAEARGPKGLLAAFICNHCPYVKAIIDRLVRDAKELKTAGIGTIAIMSNDTQAYPEDSFENMQKFAAEKGFGFPYILDETQAIARAYNAVCTPDFFGFNANLELQYRGRLDESGSRNISSPKRELLLAMQEIAQTGKTNSQQFASMGCSIKWTDKAA